MKKDYQTILKTTNSKGNVIEVCYNPLSCDGYNIFIDNDKLVGYNTQFYRYALEYVYQELHGFEELRVLFPNYGLTEDDFIYILVNLERGMDKVVMNHERGGISIYNYTKKDAAYIFLEICQDDYKILNKVIDNTNFDDLDFISKPKEDFLDNLKEVIDWLEENDFDIYEHTEIAI